MPKLIAIDVDGTLLNDDHQVTPYTAEVLHQVKDKGCEILLATGRGPQNGLPVLTEGLGLDGWMITHNGAVTVDSRTRKVISRFPMKMDEIRRMIDYARGKGIHFDICTDFDQFVENLPDDVAQMYGQFGIEPVRVDSFDGWEESIVKFTLFGGDEELSATMESLVEGYPHLNVVRSGIQFIDVFSREASKGNALKQVCEERGISRENVIAFGNYHNDIDMIQYAGLGVAMDNSPDDVKRAADEIAPSNNEDGVAKTLVRIFRLEAGLV